MSEARTLIPQGTLRWVLRWEKRPDLPDDLLAPRKVLQQGYTDTAGRSVWLDVPTFEE